MSSVTIHCFSCGIEFSLPEGPVPRGESCPGCRADVRVCKNCKHYDPKSYNECHETQADRVVEKDRRNFCDFFSPGAFAQGGNEPKRDDIFRELDSLFKKG